MSILHPILLAALAGLTAPESRLPSKSDRIVAYDIQVSLDPQAHTLKGHETLEWRNASQDAVSEAWFHLYLNPFKNEASTLLPESEGRGRRRDTLKSGEWGWTDIDAISIKSPSQSDLRGSLEFMHPDDDNADDRTVARVKLPAPVPAGQSITFEIAFSARLPHAFVRNGYHDNYHM